MPGSVRYVVDLLICGTPKSRKMEIWLWRGPDRSTHVMANGAPSGPSQSKL